MQNLELVQETEVGQFAPLMIAGVAHDLPLNVMELPERSTAMQKFALAQCRPRGAIVRDGITVNVDGGAKGCAGT